MWGSSPLSIPQWHRCLQLLLAAVPLNAISHLPKEERLSGTESEGTMTFVSDLISALSSAVRCWLLSSKMAWFFRYVTVFFSVLVSPLMCRSMVGKPGQHIKGYERETLQDIVSSRRQGTFLWQSGINRLGYLG